MAGRPSKYKKEYALQVEKLCRLGATDKEIAEFFEVDEATINRWKEAHKEFCVSIKKGKTFSDLNVADRLYQRAMGYYHEDVDIRVVKGKIVKTKLLKHYPPDTVAAIFWLKNRQKDKWRDKTETEHSGELGITWNEQKSYETKPQAN